MSFEKDFRKTRTGAEPHTAYCMMQAHAAFSLLQMDCVTRKALEKAKGKRRRCISAARGPRRYIDVACIEAKAE
jgi:hypothetical protein